jgi:hypothetical protein
MQRLYTRTYALITLALCVQASTYMSAMLPPSDRKITKKDLYIRTVLAKNKKLTAEQKALDSHNKGLKEEKDDLDKLKKRRIEDGYPYLGLVSGGFGSAFLLPVLESWGSSRPDSDNPVSFIPIVVGSVCLLCGVGYLIGQKLAPTLYKRFNESADVRDYNYNVQRIKNHHDYRMKMISKNHDEKMQTIIDMEE